MSRKKHSILLTQKPIFGRRAILPDYKYNSIIVQRFINNLMWDGKKSTAEKFVYVALETLSESSAVAKGMKPSEILEKAISLVKPDVLVRSRRVGGANYQIPVLTNSSPYMEVLAVTTAIKWIVSAVRSKKNVSLDKKIYAELEDILNGKGGALAQRESVRKIAESNKAFAHFAGQPKTTPSVPPINVAA